MQQPTEDQIRELQKFTRQNMDLFNAKTIEWIHNLTNETDAARHGSARRELGIFLTRKKLDSRKRKMKQDTKEATGSMPLATRACVGGVGDVVGVGGGCSGGSFSNSIELLIQAVKSKQEQFKVAQLTMPTTVPTTLVPTPTMAARPKATMSPNCQWASAKGRSRVMSPQNLPSPRPPLGERRVQNTQEEQLPCAKRILSVRSLKAIERDPFAQAGGQVGPFAKQQPQIFADSYQWRDV
jgi:hypothetical protein